MLKVITCLSLVPDVTTVEHIKGTPVDRRLPPGERTAGRYPDLPKNTFKVRNSFITLFLRTDQSYTGLAQFFLFIFR
jgi:hypothetical protein